MKRNNKGRFEKTQTGSTLNNRIELAAQLMSIKDRFVAAYPNGWTCQDCSCVYLPQGDCYPVMPAEDLDGGTVCPLGHGCTLALATAEDIGASLMAAHSRGEHLPARSSGRRTDLTVDEVALGLAVFGQFEGGQQ